MNFLEFWQNLPQQIDPVAFSIGFFEVRWYSLMWLIGISISICILYLNKKDFLCEKNQSAKCKYQNNNSKLKNLEFNQNSKFKIKNSENNLSNDQLQNLVIYILLGVLLGGRLGFVLFYNLSYYFQNPLEVFLPFDFSHCSMFHAPCYVGFYGMSYFGALTGAILAGHFFARKYKIDFWCLADFVAVAIPAGYFFGRIGNFLNGELYGRITNAPWGMHFDGELFLRHPSQLYEAFFEGLALFFIIILLSNILRNQAQKYYFPGILFLIYILGHAFFRFFLEFFREPDEQIGLFFNQISLGQILALAVILVVLVIWQKKKNVIR